MNSKKFSILVILVISFLVLHNTLIVLFANVTSLMRNDNRSTLDRRMYEIKIENLERDLYSYEENLKNLDIYSESNYILAKVALRDIYDFYDYVVIATDSKVNQNSAVIDENGLVGIVSTSETKTAKVNLLTGKNSISVKVSNSYGILDEYDRKKKTFIIHNINNYEEIGIGDEVTTSGLGEIDGNIKIGRVVDVEKEGIETLVYVDGYVDYDNLNYLYVVNK